MASRKRALFSSGLVACTDCMTRFETHAEVVGQVGHRRRPPRRELCPAWLALARVEQLPPYNCSLCAAPRAEVAEELAGRVYTRGEQGWVRR